MTTVPHDTHTHEDLPPDLNCVSDVHSQSSSTKLVEKPPLGPSLVDVVKKPATRVQGNLPDSDEGFQIVTKNQKKRKGSHWLPFCKLSFFRSNEESCGMCE